MYLAFYSNLINDFGLNNNLIVVIKLDLRISMCLLILRSYWHRVGVFFVFMPGFTKLSVNDAYN